MYWKESTAICLLFLIAFTSGKSLEDSSKLDSSKTGKRLWFPNGGDDLMESPSSSSSSGVPAPVVISSQPITINKVNKTGRMLDLNEGVRVYSDDESVKYNTQRKNAHFIKNFLVEKDRSAIPQNKRQAQYYSTGTASPLNSDGQNSNNVYYVQSQGDNQEGQTQDLTQAIYAALNSQQQQSQQTNYAAQQQQQVAQQDDQSTYSTQQGQQQQYYVVQPQQQQQQQQSNDSPYTSFNQAVSKLVQKIGEAQHESHGDIYQAIQNAQQPQAQTYYVQQPQQPAAPQQYQVLNDQTQYYAFQQAQPTASQVYQVENAMSQFGQVIPASSSQFVIQPQTFSTQGKPMFTVPVPMHKSSQQQHHSGERSEKEPMEKVSHSSRESSHEVKGRREDVRFYQHKRPIMRPNNIRRNEGERIVDKEDRKRDDREHGIMDRVIDALKVSNKKSMTERIETNAAIPVLSVSGFILGLGALAAGWYLSKGNREVGIIRRTGKPSQHPGIIKLGGRRKRQIMQGASPLIPHQTESEVDQATFFQTIIQQALEKEQQKYDTVPTGSSGSSSINTKYESYPVSAHVRNDRINVKPHSYSRDDHDREDSISPKLAKEYKKYKSAKKSWRATKQFAKVAVPSVVLGGAILGIGALIAFWYFSGQNREIAFLEPAAYSRKKRSLPLADGGWLHKTLTSIHSNPYEKMVKASKDRIGPLGMTEESSKDYEQSSVSNAFVGGALAAGAVLAMTALILAWFYSDQTGHSWLENAEHVGYGNPHGGWGPPHGGGHGGHSRNIRSINDITYGNKVDNPGFLSSILSNLDLTQSHLLTKLQEAEYAKWQDMPCAKRLFCHVMTTQSEDTIRLMEKRMATFFNMLPDSVSNSLSRSLSEVMMSINKRDCSLYTCGGHSSLINQPSSVSSNQPR